MEEKDSSVSKPEEEESGQPEPRKFTPEELKKVLEEHADWLFSKGEKGMKANLQKAILWEANLQKATLGEANLQEADLQGANLQEAYLWKANLQKAILWTANLQEATLGEANLQEADLGRSDLREAILQDADLTDAKGLHGGQLAGANVSGAKLPEGIQKFEEGLKVVEEASRNARKLFFAMLSACAYALLTIATTTDVRLLTNSASSPLPIIRTEIPIVWFYIVAPLILLCLYFYFHLYMQRLWEGLAILPAVFPDGRPLDQKAYPWLLTGLVRAHVLHLKENRPPLSYLQEWISILLPWCFMPATLICFWLRYIPRQDWFGTGLHIGLLVVAVWAGVLFYRLAVGTLRMDETELPLWNNPFRKIMTYKRGVLAVRTGLILCLLSMGTINGVPEFQFSDVRTWVPYAFERFGFSPFANFREKDVSIKPSNWSGKLEEIKGAPLRKRNLRYAEAERAFLVRADLRGADLRGAILKEADLREADLKNANLHQVDLQKANLNGANLWGANLQKATLFMADLQRTKLGKADLRGADLRRVNFSGAHFGNPDYRPSAYRPTDDPHIALLDGANLQWANFNGAIGLYGNQIRRANSAILAFYGEDDRWILRLPEDHNYRLRKLDLSEYNLSRQRLSFSNLQGFNLRGADLEEADLQGTQLDGADLGRTKLRAANLRGARLSEANLEEANLEGANMHGAYFWTANLQEANLLGANLQEANLAHANLQEANLREAKLQGARNLTMEQLSRVETLYEAKLDPELMEQIKKKHPHLLEKPKED